MARKAPQTRLASRARLMQSCNSGREFKTLFLVPCGMECKLAENVEIRPFWMARIMVDTGRLARLGGWPGVQVLIGDLREAA